MMQYGAGGVGELFGKLQALMQEYSDYPLTTTKEMQFREPQNELEKSLVQKEKRRQLLFLVCANCIMAFLTVSCFFMKTGILGIAIMCALLTIFIVFLFLTIKRKGGILRGRIVYVFFRKPTGSVAGKRLYYASVIIDVPKKGLLTNLTILKSDVEQCKEGSEAYVVRVGDSAVVKPIKNA